MKLTDIKQSSEQDYLESIYLISLMKTNVKSSDIVKKTNFSRAAISTSMNKLIKQGFIKMDENKDITLTKQGLKIAKETYKKHTTIAKYLTTVLGVSKRNAEKEACLIEHIISDETYEKILQSLEKL